MRALLDINVLLALIDVGHIHHPIARAWWHAHQAFGWATCPVTQNGFVRIISLPGYSSPISIGDALDVLQRQTMQAGHEFWNIGLSIADGTIFDRSHLVGPRQITDVYLLALAVRNGGRLVTFDRGIPLRAVRGATPANLVVI